MPLLLLLPLVLFVTWPAIDCVCLYAVWVDQPLMNKWFHPQSHPVRVHVHPPCALNSWETGFLGGFRWQAGDFIAHLYANEYPAERHPRVKAYADWANGQRWLLPFYTFVT